jgi:Tol biopolymer transport system component
MAGSRQTIAWSIRFYYAGTMEEIMKKLFMMMILAMLFLTLGCENLVYVRKDSGVNHIYKMRDNGDAQMSISPPSTMPFDYPDVSPDGSKIAYTDGEKVFISDINDIGGATTQELATPPGAKSFIRWAPNQEVVGYANGDGNTAKIYLSAINVANFLQVTFPAGTQSDNGGLDLYLGNNVQRMVYSRDGKLFSMFYNGTQPASPITSNSGATLHETLPVFSHDYNLLAYRVSYQLAAFGTVDYIQVVATGTWSAVQSIILQPPVVKGSISAIAFSKKDNRLYVAARTSDAAESREIFSVNLDGSDQRQLTENTVYDSRPDAIP